MEDHRLTFSILDANLTKRIDYIYALLPDDSPWRLDDMYTVGRLSYRVPASDHLGVVATLQPV